MILNIGLNIKDRYWMVGVLQSREYVVRNVLKETSVLT